MAYTSTPATSTQPVAAIKAAEASLVESVSSVEYARKLASYGVNPDAEGLIGLRTQSDPIAKTVHQYLYKRAVEHVQAGNNVVKAAVDAGYAVAGVAQAASRPTLPDPGLVAQYSSLPGVKEAGDLLVKAAMESCATAMPSAPVGVNKDDKDDEDDAAANKPVTSATS